jgi:hypothetical protein
MEGKCIHKTNLCIYKLDIMAPRGGVRMQSQKQRAYSYEFKSAPMLTKKNMLMSPERLRPRERLRWRRRPKTENYRLDFSSERASHINKPATVQK